jgi:hypothetical protein
MNNLTFLNNWSIQRVRFFKVFRFSTLLASILSDSVKLGAEIGPVFLICLIRTKGPAARTIGNTFVIFSVNRNVILLIESGWVRYGLFNLWCERFSPLRLPPHCFLAIRYALCNHTTIYSLAFYFKGRSTTKNISPFSVIKFSSKLKIG